MNNPHADAVRSCLKQALAHSDPKTLGMIMFKGFFEQYPETAHLYAHTTLEDFAARKFKAVSELILDAVRNPEYATYQMVSEVQRHEYFDARDVEYFYAMAEHCGNAIRQTLSQQLKGQWNDELETLWQESLQATKACIQQAKREATY